MLSGDMADIFSNLYLALSVGYYHMNNNASELLTNYGVKRLMNENQLKINKVIDNLGPERFLLQHLKKTVKDIKYEEERNLFNEVMNNENIYIKNNILEDLEKVNTLDKDDPKFKILKDRIINVGEFEN